MSSASLGVVGAAALNVSINLVGWSEITRAGRNTVFPIVGSTLPVVVTEVAGPRQVTIVVRTDNPAEYDALDAALAAGLPVLLATVDFALPGMYAAVGDVSRDLPAPRGEQAVWNIPLTEVESVATQIGLAVANLGGLTAVASGKRNGSGTAAAALGALTATATGKRTTTATAAAPLGPLTGTAVSP